MSDLRTRIAAVLSDALVADNSILTVQYGSGSTSNIVVNCNALADAVIRELEADYVLVPKSHTLARKNFRYGEHYGI